MIWNLLQRYTREGDLVVDPFCGGGTTLDVARSLGRERAASTSRRARDDIERADARALPLEAARPTSSSWTRRTRRTSSTPARASCIGELDAFEPAYFEAMDAAFAEAERCLRDRRYLAVYVSDTFKKKKGFVGIGARSSRLLERALPADRPRGRRARQPQAREAALPPRRGRGELLPARLQPPPDLQEGARRRAPGAPGAEGAARRRPRAR